MCKKQIIALLSMAILTSLLCAKSGQQIANDLRLNPSSKAIKQWERLLNSEEKLKSIGADKLSADDKAELKKYLTAHAADSDRPTVAGR